MADLVVIVPTRGRPHAVKDLIEPFLETCRENTSIIFAVDDDDPDLEAYSTAVRENLYIGRVDPDGSRTWTKQGWEIRAGVCVVDNPANMVGALNRTAAYVLANGMDHPKAIAFMGDDHRPRTQGWDTAYLEALAAKPGMVYGNDRIQGMKLPTQIAMSASLVQALGHMAPPVLKHMYVDNYWLQLGLAAGCITYLPDVTVEHLHPYAGTAEVDEGYLRVNAREVFDHDERAFAAYWAEHAERDVAAARQVLVA